MKEKKRVELKEIQAELNQGLVRGLYWFFGPEIYLQREMGKLIRKSVLGDSASVFQSDRFEGGQTSAEEVLDAGATGLFSQGSKLIWVEHADALEHLEKLSSQISKAAPIAEGRPVFLLFSKDIDLRKKVHQAFNQQGACIECAEVPLEHRKTWILSLAKKIGLTDLSSEIVSYLETLDPWDLSLIQQELLKISIADIGDRETLLLPSGERSEAARYFEAVATKNWSRALQEIPFFSTTIDETLKSLGWLSYAIRTLLGAAHGQKVSYGFSSRYAQLTHRMQLHEWFFFQECLQNLEIGIKSRPTSLEALWLNATLELRAFLSSSSK